jgi:hypothetical protein
MEPWLHNFRDLCNRRSAQFFSFVQRASGCQLEVEEPSAGRCSERRIALDVEGVGARDTAG